ncbi:hypothetical protein ACXHQ0_16875 [Vibrio antiquarius]|uniref:Uncharacterized protein n=1 Tax=Vibrio parahaemolyticus TaxID=670 RepID=A0AA46UQC7_VIBPH|nr:MULTISPECIES: hypothetical protein [Vibrio harveyi group]EGR3229043.1 hypothetical protein [Vibrio parahaemolyticus]EGR5926583.1 hypothetical protein [Vibrio parahaemolyticus]EJG0181450.1 hypothetical protein [Vibrio parahaemolyticus]KOE93084.1 hypothetical protein ACS91_01095 [Vibrio parahaemolyticus]MCS0310755.1 hypothetical protein [Vibrio diabolicus]
MEKQLSVSAAKQLIEFIFSTNYRLAPDGDGLFASKEEAISFVESSEYNPCNPLCVCFDTKQGSYWDSVSATFNGEIWEMEDYSMGGAYASGTTIEDALINLRKQCDLDDDFCPVELSIIK